MIKVIFGAEANRLSPEQWVNIYEFSKTGDAEIIDLNAEALLDPIIAPENINLEWGKEPSHILLIGATGFFRTHLLNELLNKNTGKYLLPDKSIQFRTRY
jgi:hypothetical protein